MIPVFWRYTIANYLKIFFLSVGAIVSMLIVSRFKEIAHFAVLSGEWPNTILFTLYQIPFILPMAIPISVLLASFLLLQNMSRSQETSALRAAGFSLCNLLSPLLFVSGFLMLLNFSLSAKIAPSCVRESMKILYQEAPPDPLVLLQRRKLLKHKNMFIQLQEEENQIANFLLIAPNGNTRLLDLISASRLRMENNQLVGDNMAIVTHLSNEGEDFYPLLIENQANMSIGAPALSTFLTKRPPKTTIRSLDFRMLTTAYTTDEKKAKAAFSELLRRCSLSLAVLSFTLLGCAFGFESEKSHSKKGVLTMLVLALMLLSSYFLGKGLRTNSLIAITSVFLPHFIIWVASFYRLRRIAHGIST